VTQCGWGAVLALVVLVGCGGDPTATAPARTRTPTPLHHAVTGTIAGTVRFDGAVPAMAEVRFGGFGECAAQHSGTVYAGDVLVKDGLVENAFVWLKDGLGDRVFAVPEAPVEVDQVGCLYEPRIAGAQVGQTVRFVNGDQLLHNVRGTPKASAQWNVSLSRRGASRDIVVERPEVMVSVRCDLHPWMQSWLGVVDHPYFALTAADGTFTLRDVPPGDYAVAVWHERLGVAETRVSLAAKGSATADFTLVAKP